MSTNYIFYLIVGLSVTATLRYLNKATKKIIEANCQGVFHLRMHKLYNVIGYVALVLCVIVTVGPILTDEPDVAIYILMFFMFLLFGGIGLLSVLYYRNHFVLFDDSKIEVRNVFGNTKSIVWNSIKKARFNPASGLLILISDAEQKIKIHQHLVGLSQFVTYLEDKTTFTAKDLKLPVRRNNAA